jgi:curved DNA-binding protein CbpA
MKLDSKLFDRIRVKPDRVRDDRGEFPPCAYPGCDEAGSHRAPVGRHREGEYHHFCLEHVRLYNQSYNYFAGMSDDAVAAYQRDAVTGHRPTWRMGVDAPFDPRTRPSGTAARFARAAGVVRDPFELFGGRRAPPPPPEPERRPVTAMQRRAFDVMDLDETATPPEIKARYKSLVKRHHPDANGGDRSYEERLRQVIQAYGVLKGAGFC